MEKNQIVVLEKNGKMSLGHRVGAGALILASSAGAMAAAGDGSVDTAGVVSAISGLGTGVAAIGGAILLILVAIKGYSLIKRAL